MIKGQPQLEHNDQKGTGRNTTCDYLLCLKQSTFRKILEKIKILSLNNIFLIRGFHSILCSLLMLFWLNESHCQIMAELHIKFRKAEKRYACTDENFTKVYILRHPLLFSNSSRQPSLYDEFENRIFCNPHSLRRISTVRQDFHNFLHQLSIAIHQATRNSSGYTLEIVFHKQSFIWRMLGRFFGPKTSERHEGPQIYKLTLEQTVHGSVSN